MKVLQVNECSPTNGAQLYKLYDEGASIFMD